MTWRDAGLETNAEATNNPHSERGHKNSFRNESGLITISTTGPSISVMKTLGSKNMTWRDSGLEANAEATNNLHSEKV